MAHSLRRVHKGSTPTMTYRIDPDRDLTEEVRAVAREQIDQAIDLLEDKDTNLHEAIHLSRRRFKRVRAVLRLVRYGDKAFAKSENARFRDIAHSLSHARDAAALVETFEGMSADLAGEIGADPVERVHAALVARRDRIAAASGDLGYLVREAIARCRAGRAAFDTLHLPEDRGDAARLVARGATRIYRRAREALAAAGRDPVPERFHEMRKRVNDHLFNLRLLQDLDRETLKPRRKAVSALAKHLGHHHDLSVMVDHLRAEPEIASGQAERAELEAALLRRMDRQGETILAEADPLFADKPIAWRRRIAELYRKGGD